MQLSAALVIFVATIAISLIGLFGAPKLVERSLFRPYWFLRRKQYDTVIMSGFVHADLMHLIFNMMTFYFFAFPLERYIGTVRFVALYLAGLLISHAGTYYKQRGNPEYACLGASGAISWQSRDLSVSTVLVTEEVGLEPIDDGIWDLHFGPVRLGRFDERTHRVHPAGVWRRR